jgi:YD repeat-containing protein
MAGLIGVAEQLRRKAVPIPDWLLDYPVPAYPTPATTPAIDAKIEETGGRNVLHVHGGVDLSPKISRVEQAPPELIRAAQEAVARAPGRAGDIRVTEFRHGTQQYQATILPGGGALAVGGMVHEATDLAVPLGQGRDLRLTRSFSSLSNGRGGDFRLWSLGLPRLNILTYHTQRTADGVINYPRPASLNDAWGRMVEQFVPAPGFKPGDPIDLVSTSKSGPVRLTMQDSRLKPGLAVYHVDYPGDRYLEFMPDGTLWAVASPGQIVSFDLRGPKAGPFRIEAITALAGSAKVRIDLVRDATGRVVGAKGSNGQEVAYTYNAAGLVASARGPQGTESYQYDEAGKAVTRVQRGQSVLWTASYNASGQVVSAMEEGGKEMPLRPHGLEDGRMALTRGKGVEEVTAVYDADMRIQELRDQHGALKFLRGPDGKVRDVAHIAADGTKTELDPLTLTPKSASPSPAPGPFVTAGKGVEVAVQKGQDGSVTRQTFQLAGRPEQTLAVDYAGKGQVSRVLLGSTELAGMKFTPEGLLEQMSTPQGGVDVTWDPTTKLPLSARWSDGRSMQFVYDKANPRDLRGITVKWGDSTFEVRSDGTQVTEIKGLDGGTCRLMPGTAQSESRTILPTGLDIRAIFDPAGNLTKAKVKDQFHLREFQWHADPLLRWKNGAPGIRRSVQVDWAHDESQRPQPRVLLAEAD